LSMLPLGKRDFDSLINIITVHRLNDSTNDIRVIGDELLPPHIIIFGGKYRKYAFNVITEEAWEIKTYEEFKLLRSGEV